jgi:hypothetical protein
MSDLRVIAGVLSTMRAVSEQYKKTFAGTQILIVVVTLAALVTTHRLAAALAFLATMQLGAVVGAMWAASLKSRIEHGRLKVRG